MRLRGSRPERVRHYRGRDGSLDLVVAPRQRVRSKHEPACARARRAGPADYLQGWLMMGQRAWFRTPFHSRTSTTPLLDRPPRADGDPRPSLRSQEAVGDARPRRRGVGSVSASTAALARPRDRFVDLVRVGAMVAVVVLHWLSVMPHLQGATVRDVNVVDVMPGLWPLTWMGDVMALFFFAGGYANWTSCGRPRARGDPRPLRRTPHPTAAAAGVRFLRTLAGSRPDTASRGLGGALTATPCDDRPDDTVRPTVVPRRLPRCGRLDALDRRGAPEVAVGGTTCDGPWCGHRRWRRLHSRQRLAACCEPRARAARPTPARLLLRRRLTAHAEVRVESASWPAPDWWLWAC
jgi:hypothetical protein